MPDLLKPEGAFGAAPVGAPHETTQPLHADVVADQLARAAANEKPLAPFAPPQVPVSPVENAASALLAAARREAPVERSHQPAASSGDSPSRGIPRPIKDPGKKITGGFGAAADAQYFALDGAELRVLANHLLTKLSQRMDDDLRFSVAITYPRVKVELILRLSGYAKETTAESEVVVAPVVHEKTPVEVAVGAGAQPFTDELVEMRREFDDENNPENPPDRLRDEVGLEKPRKQYVEAAGGRMLVDRPTALGGSF